MCDQTLAQVRNIMGVFVSKCTTGSTKWFAKPAEGKKMCCSLTDNCVIFKICTSFTCLSLSEEMTTLTDSICTLVGHWVWRERFAATVQFLETNKNVNLRIHSRVGVVHFATPLNCLHLMRFEVPAFLTYPAIHVYRKVSPNLKQGSNLGFVKLVGGIAGHSQPVCSARAKHHVIMWRQQKYKLFITLDCCSLDCVGRETTFPLWKSHVGVWLLRDLACCLLPNSHFKTKAVNTAMEHGFDLIRFDKIIIDVVICVAELNRMFRFIYFLL